MSKSAEKDTPNLPEEEKPKKKLLPRWLSLPFLIVVAAVAVICFVREDNYMRSHDNDIEIARLKQEIKLNHDSVIYFNAKAAELQADREQIERIARQQYHMKRADEDIYITDIR